MSDPNLNLGVGGGQPPLGAGPSLLDEERALKKGNKGPLIVGLLAAIGVVFGLGFVLLQGGDDDPYGAIGQQINRMKTENFNGFWACALPNERLDDVQTNGDLREAITKRARSSPQRYAEHVRSQCIVKLAEHRPQLRELIAPEDLHAQLTDLESALDALNDGWDEYLRELERQSEYDEAALRPPIGKIAKGWYDYRVAFNGLNDTIRPHVEPSR